MNIAVIGAGAVGGWVAARLAMANNRVMALTSHGPLESIELVEDGRSQTADFTSFDGTADLLILAVKAPALDAAAVAVRPRIGAATMILPMVNGVPWWFLPGQALASVDPGQRIAMALPRPAVIGCVVHAACSRSAPGQVTVAHADKLILGEPGGGQSERVERLASLFTDAGIAAEPSANVRRAVWYKLWGNATINPLSALTRSTADKLLADAAIRSFMLEAMAELALVGDAVGCAIEQSGEDRMEVTARLGAFKPSMLQDVEAGRSIELEALVGAPREIARMHGIATPALDRIYALAKLMTENLSLT